MKLISLTKEQFAIVDDSDYVKLNEVKWCSQWSADTQSFYAKRGIWDTTTKKVKTVLMHRLILGITDKSVFVDHVDHNTLNNVRSNLIATTCRSNNANKTGKTTGKYSSKHVGVSFNIKRGKWVAQFGGTGWNKHLGYFESEMEASVAYQNAIKVCK